MQIWTESILLNVVLRTACLCFYLCSWNTVLENLKWTPYPNLGNVWATFGSKCHFPWLTPCTLNGDTKSKGMPKCILCPFLTILQRAKQGTPQGTPQTQLHLNQWNNSCWLQESGLRVGHSGKSSLTFWQRVLFHPRNRNILSVTPSVGNKYLTDLSNATDQGHKEVNRTENSSNKNYRNKILWIWTNI